MFTEMADGRGAERGMVTIRGSGTRILPLVVTAAILSAPAWGASIPNPLPDPDGRPADMSKPVQVFILMGQSNMLGFGNAGNLKGIAGDKYPYLVDDAGNWNVRKDVRNVFFCMAKLRINDWLTAAKLGIVWGNLSTRLC